MGQFGRGVIAFLPDLKYLVKYQTDKVFEINLLLINFTHPKQIGNEKIENQHVRGAVLINHKILIKGEQKQAVMGVGGACIFLFE